MSSYRIAVEDFDKRVLDLSKESSKCLLGYKDELQRMQSIMSLSKTSTRKDLSLAGYDLAKKLIIDSVVKCENKNLDLVKFRYSVSFEELLKSSSDDDEYYISLVSKDFEKKVLDYVIEKVFNGMSVEKIDLDSSIDLCEDKIYKNIFHVMISSDKNSLSLSNDDLKFLVLNSSKSQELVSHNAKFHSFSSVCSEVILVGVLEIDFFDRHSPINEKRKKINDFIESVKDYIESSAFKKQLSKMILAGFVSEYMETLFVQSFLKHIDKIFLSSSDLKEIQTEYSLIEKSFSEYYRYINQKKLVLFQDHAKDFLDEMKSLFLKQDHSFYRELADKDITQVEKNGLLFDFLDSHTRLKSKKLVDEFLLARKELVPELRNRFDNESISLIKKTNVFLTKKFKALKEENESFFYLSLILDHFDCLLNTLEGGIFDDLRVGEIEYNTQMKSNLVKIFFFLRNCSVEIFKEKNK